MHGANTRCHIDGAIIWLSGHARLASLFLRLGTVRQKTRSMPVEYHQVTLQFQAWLTIFIGFF